MQNDPTVQKPWVHFHLSLANPPGTPPEALQNNRLLICLDSSSQKSGASGGEDSFFARGSLSLQGKHLFQSGLKASHGRKIPFQGLG